MIYYRHIIFETKDEADKLIVEIGLIKALVDKLIVKIGLIKELVDFGVDTTAVVEKMKNHLLN